MFDLPYGLREIISMNKSCRTKKKRNVLNNE